MRQSHAGVKRGHDRLSLQETTFLKFKTLITHLHNPLSGTSDTEAGRGRIISYAIKPLFGIYMYAQVVVVLWLRSVPYTLILTQLHQQTLTQLHA